MWVLVVRLKVNNGGWINGGVKWDQPREAEALAILGNRAEMTSMGISSHRKTYYNPETEPDHSFAWSSVLKRL